MLWKLVLAIAGAYCFYIPALACDAVDSVFEPKGEIVFSNVDDGYLAKGSIAYLGEMLGAAYEKRVGDAATEAFHISINEKKLRIVHLLETGIRGRQFERNVTCVDGAWGYTEGGSTSAEGSYRKYETNIRLAVLSNGNLEIQYDKMTIRGLIFKTKSLVSVTVHFKRRESANEN